MKFRGKEVDAIQWQDDCRFSDAPPPWLVHAIARPPGPSGAIMRAGDTLYVWTDEGSEPAKVEPGGWVVLNSSVGTVHGCDDGVWKLMYEPAA